MAKGTIIEKDEGQEKGVILINDSDGMEPEWSKADKIKYVIADYSGFQVADFVSFNYNETPNPDEAIDLELLEVKFSAEQKASM